MMMVMVVMMMMMMMVQLCKHMENKLHVDQ